MKKSELQEIIREEISKVLKEKIANESGNIFHKYNGKRFKKVGEGKWMEVSEYGMTKKEHQGKEEDLKNKLEKLGKYRHVPGGGDGWGGSFIDGKYIEHENSKHNKKHDKLTINKITHRDIASKLSDKEYTDEEVGISSSKVLLPKDLKELEKVLGEFNNIETRLGSGTYGVDLLKVQSKVDPKRFLTIFPKYDRGRYLKDKSGDYKWEKKERVNGQYIVNVTSGSIDNPSSAANATWYNLGDKSYDKDGISNILSKYFSKSK